MTRLGIITGLASETRCLSRWRGIPEIDIVCAGADPERAATLAGRLVGGGCRGLLSFGVAGGLDPALPSGSLVLSERVVLDDRSWSCAPEWRQALASKLGAEMEIHSGILAGARAAVTTAEGKADLHRRAGAVAVDMESHAVAAVAAGRGVPFLAIRVVADPWDQAILPWMPGLIDAGGRVRLFRAAMSVLGHPADWPEVARIGRQNRVALECLGRVAVLGGPLFGFAELSG